MTPQPKPVPDDLRQLAAKHGVSTSYRNERRAVVEVDAEVVIRVLGLLEVEAGTESGRRRELAKLATGEIGETDLPLPITEIGSVPLRRAKEQFYKSGAEISHLLGDRF